MDHALKFSRTNVTQFVKVLFNFGKSQVFNPLVILLN